MIRNKDIFLVVFNESLKKLGLINDIIELTWITSFRGVGSFSLECIIDNTEFIRPGNFIMRNNGSSICIIERAEISRTVEGVTKYVVSGRSAEVILDWRVLYYPTTYKDIARRSVIYSLLRDNFFGASVERQIDFLTYGEAKKVEPQPGTLWQLPAGSVYEAVYSLLEYDEGLHAYYYSDKLIITRRYQTDRSHVVFAEGLDTIAAWSYTQDRGQSRNVAIVAGEGEGINRTTVVAGGASGVSRREIYVDARDLSRETDDGTLSEQEYRRILNQRGNDYLDDNRTTYTTVVEPTVNAYPDMDVYWIGSIVTIDTGVYKGRAYISEITEIFDETGYSIFPSFEVERVNFILATEDSKDILTENEEQLLSESIVEEQ